MNGDPVLDILDHALHQPAGRWNGVPAEPGKPLLLSLEGDARIDEVIRDGLEIEVMGEHHAALTLAHAQTILYTSN